MSRVHPQARAPQGSAAADLAQASVLSAEWLQELEAAAIANWSKLMGAQ